MTKKEYQAQYRLLHREEAKKYRAKHSDEIKAYRKQYRTKHRDKLNARNKQYNAEHSDEFNARNKQYNAAFRQRCLSAYGGKCVCCGESIERFLTIDHVNGDGAEHRRSLTGKKYGGGSTTYRWLIKHNFPEGFQVLCFNCNTGKYFNNGICPHKEAGGEDLTRVAGD